MTPRGDGPPSTGDTGQLFAAAIAHHQRGQFAEAEILYQRILAADPRHADSLHYAGVAALQRGRPQDAADLIGKSISLRANPEAHYHLGLAMAALRRFEETAEQNRKAIALKPDYVVAYINLGNALKELGELHEAAACYERVITLDPKHATAHYNLANVLVTKRDFEAAIKSFERTLAVQPNFPQAQLNFGTALIELGRFDEALEKFNAALSANPDFVEALQGRALVLILKGKPQEALGTVGRALDIQPTADAKLLFVECVKVLDSYPTASWLAKHLIAAISEPWGYPHEFAIFIANALRAGGPTAELISRSGFDDFKLTRADLDALAKDRLLLAVLDNMLVIDPQLELVLTAARHDLLDMASAGETVDDELLDFACALARESFINEYVFDSTGDEAVQAGKVREQLVAALESGNAPGPLQIAVVAAYVPLHRIPGADRLLALSWPSAVGAVLTQQLREPQTEIELRPSLPLLTPIDDNVSLSVQRQYEENPYPRWTKIQLQNRAASLDDTIRKMLPHAPFHPTGKRECDILFAGCGTGHEPVNYSRTVAGAKILAVDLSLTSLAHAKRKTLELGIGNIDYAQADILKLPSLGRTFDLIVSSGVLHHMADPFEAWRGLLNIVRPGGLMAVGLYSDAARKAFVAARELIAANKFQADADGIRAARRAIRSLPDDAQAKTVAGVRDFFSMSECRDLLFHVQEHRLTIPQIRDFIRECGVRFLGFRIGQHVVGQYLARFPQDPTLIDLDNWHAFETDHPLTFIGMYQFVIQMPQR